MMKKFLAVAATAMMVSSGILMAHTVAKKGMKADLVLMPKFLGILVFDQANQGAQEAHKELQNPGKLEFLGPTPEISNRSCLQSVTCLIFS